MTVWGKMLSKPNFLLRKEMIRNKTYTINDEWWGRGIQNMLTPIGGNARIRVDFDGAMCNCLSWNLILYVI